jgi:hypothetical protein
MTCVCKHEVLLRPNVQAGNIHHRTVPSAGMGYPALFALAHIVKCDACARLCLAVSAARDEIYSEEPVFTHGYRVKFALVYVNDASDILARLC